MTPVRCPYCRGSGFVSRIGLAMTAIWLIVVALRPWLPATLGGVLILTFIGLALWKWSGRPPKKTPAREPLGPHFRGPIVEEDEVTVNRAEVLDALVCLHWLGRLDGKRCGQCQPCLMAARIDGSDDTAYWRKITQEADERNARIDGYREAT